MVVYLHRNMIRVVAVMVAAYLVVACGSYNPNSEIEINMIPAVNDAGVDTKEFIDKSLKMMYPSIGRYTLENELDGHKAEFFIGGSSYKVTFTSNGDWKKSEVKIKYTQAINPKVREALRKTEFTDWQIVKKELDQKPDETEYKFHFKKGETVYDVRYDQQGRLVKKEKTIIERVE